MEETNCAAAETFKSLSLFFCIEFAPRKDHRRADLLLLIVLKGVSESAAAANQSLQVQLAPLSTRKLLAASSRRSEGRRGRGQSASSSAAPAAASGGRGRGRVRGRGHAPAPAEVAR